MAQSINNKKRGVTLIELVVYMGIFMILVSGVLYSALYMQKILEYNAIEYKTQEQIYRQLGLLQQHVNSATRVEMGSGSLRIYNRFGYVEQVLQEKILHMKYVYAGKPDIDIIPYPYIRLEKFTFTKETGHETLFGNSILSVEIVRSDLKGRLKKIREWLVK